MDFVLVEVKDAMEKAKIIWARWARLEMRIT
jgi:hypothetical protein